MSFDWLVARKIAHRGWHGAGRPESSLAAATAARAAGYAVECDVQLSADGEAMVFHDDTLERLTGAQGRVSDFTLTQLKGLGLRAPATPHPNPLPASGERESGRGLERIPTLAELLARLAGEVPLVCEIKSGFDGDLRLTERAAEIAAGYDGPLAFKSFDPAPIAHLRARGCARPLGVVAEADYDDPYFAALTPAEKRDCAAMLHIGRTAPDFLSWRVDDLPHAAVTLMRALGHKPVMTWTVRTPAQWALARAYADQAVFEGEPP